MEILICYSRTNKALLKTIELSRELYLKSNLVCEQNVDYKFHFSLRLTFYNIKSKTISHWNHYLKPSCVLQLSSTSSIQNENNFVLLGCHFTCCCSCVSSFKKENFRFENDAIIFWYFSNFSSISHAREEEDDKELLVANAYKYVVIE